MKKTVLLYFLLLLVLAAQEVGAFSAVLFQGQRGSVLPEREVQHLFKEFLTNENLALNFPEAGCWERTYEMSWLLFKKGIIPLKSFMNSEGDVGALIRVLHPLKKGTYLLWNNHVAPVVLVKKNGQVIPYTLDPSLFSRAVPTEEWENLLKKNSTYGKISLSYLSATQGGPYVSTPWGYQDENYRQSNLTELKKYREFGEDPAKAADWYFQKENEEFKAGGGY